SEPKPAAILLPHNKFPPTPRVGLVWPRPHRPALILPFAKKFFRAPHTRVRMRWTGQIFWLLASPFFPPSPPPNAFGGRLADGKLYPVTAAQLLPIFTGFLAPIHFLKLAKNWIEEYWLALCLSRFIYQAQKFSSCRHPILFSISSSRAELASSAPI